ncbi:MAG: bi-domain-containing oxidoreductase [Bryobacterales bacterium]|nr:bi-domain-containing oxidoreductase [Bryobacterales bacterium]
MKQVIRKGIRDIIIDEVPDPLPSRHHVLIRPLYSLISSGTETASIHQEGVLKEVADNPSHLRKVWEVMKVNGPVATIREVSAKFHEYAALGYAGAGIVIEKGAEVMDLEIGDRVAYGGEGTGHGETIITGRNLVARVPAEVPFQDACFATLGSIALNSVRIAQIGLGDRVAVIGMGLVGQLVAQLVRLQGGVVLASDLRPERLELARKLGAHHVLSGGSIREPVLAATDGKGADCVIVAAAAKSAGPCRTALEICRDRGRMVIVGAVDMSFPWNDMYLKEIQLYMARAYGPGSYDPVYEKQGRDYPFGYVRWTENRNMEEFLRLAATGAIQTRPLVTHEFPLDQAPEAYQTIMAPDSSSLAVLLRYQSAASADPVADYKPVRKVMVAGRAAEPSKDTLGVALVGSGNLARWAHLPAVQKISGAQIRAIHSSNGVRGKSYAVRFGAAYTATDYQQILDDQSVHAVLIVSRNQEHASQALAALKAGKHVFVEKPMALTVEECRALENAVASSGKQLMVGFNRRFAPFYLPLQQQLRKRNSPAVVQCRINSPGISGSYWMADPRIGGAILGEACHFVDLMYWMLGSEPVSVFAYSLPTGKQDPIGENNMAACFQFADGSVGTLTYCTVGSKTSGGERVEVYAQGIGMMTEDFKRLTTKGSLRTSRGKWFAEKGYDAQMQEFFSAIRAGRPPAVTVRDGSRATIGCLRLLDSARTHLACRIDMDSELLEKE